MVELNSLDETGASEYFIFKHSATCPISASAHDAVSAAESSLSQPIYKIVVQSNRALSNAVSEKFGIRHESPQLILVRDGAAVWHASHYGINRDAIVKAAG